jgi:hypothetical protein
LKKVNVLELLLSARWANSSHLWVCYVFGFGTPPHLLQGITKDATNGHSVLPRQAGLLELGY